MLALPAARLNKDMGSLICSRNKNNFANNPQAICLHVGLTRSTSSRSAILFRSIQSTGNSIRSQDGRQARATTGPLNDRTPNGESLVRRATTTNLASKAGFGDSAVQTTGSHRCWATGWCGLAAFTPHSNRSGYEDLPRQPGFRYSALCACSGLSLAVTKPGSDCVSQLGPN